MGIQRKQLLVWYITKESDVVWYIQFLLLKYRLIPTSGNDKMKLWHIFRNL